MDFTAGFLTVDTWDGPDLLLVTLLDFFLPQTNDILGEFFWFRLEDPDNPGSFVPTRDLQLECGSDIGLVEHNGCECVTHGFNMNVRVGPRIPFALSINTFVMLAQCVHPGSTARKAIEDALWSAACA